MDEEEPDSRRRTTRLERWKNYAEISDLGAIARRIFVMNGFDGALTMLGVSIGAFMAHMEDPAVIILAGISGSFAMGLSGFSGAYMAESAERTKGIKEMENALLTPLEDKSIHMEAARFATNVTALVTAMSPVVTGLTVISPYFLGSRGIIDMDTAFTASLLLSFTVLTLMGLFLARITKGNMLIHGLKMLAIGITVAILCSLVSMWVGA